ncbi:hypothetical protein ABZ897_58365 [Nonomuraea sp. NPDC046802]|uniref:hypothetical protein n=1 Tax=Nonomuraea sp. NPDC046802 TaxID=3154919 RepID=UPI00340A0062
MLLRRRHPGDAAAFDGPVRAPDGAAVSLTPDGLTLVRWTSAPAEPGEVAEVRWTV